MREVRGVRRETGGWQEARGESVGANDRDVDGGGVRGQLAHISGPAGPDRSGTRPLAVRLCTAKSVVCAAAACSCPAWSTRHGPPRRRYTHRAASRHPCASTPRDVRRPPRVQPASACLHSTRSRATCSRGGKSERHFIKETPPTQRLGAQSRDRFVLRLLCGSLLPQERPPR